MTIIVDDEDHYYLPEPRHGAAECIHQRSNERDHNKTGHTAAHLDHEGEAQLSEVDRPRHSVIVAVEDLVHRQPDSPHHGGEVDDDAHHLAVVDEKDADDVKKTDPPSVWALVSASSSD